MRELLVSRIANYKHTVDPNVFFAEMFSLDYRCIINTLQDVFLQTLKL